MKRLVLGDVHGHWQTIRDIYDKEQPEEVIILGDYVDSFVLKPEDHKQCLDYLLDLQKIHNSKYNNKSFTLLIGNHDFHYIDNNERYTGYNAKTHMLCSDTIKDAIDNNNMQFVYLDNINHTIYSHAGVSNTWMNTYQIPELQFINEASFRYFEFTLGDRFDMSGDSKYSSPIWIRPYSLGNDMYVDKDNITWRQVVGHTQTHGEIIDFNDTKFTQDIEHPNMILCDALPFQYLVETLNDDYTLQSYKITNFEPFDLDYRQ